MSRLVHFLSTAALMLVVAGCQSAPNEPTGELILLSHFPYDEWHSPVAEAIGAAEGTAAATDADGVTRVNVQMGRETLTLTQYPSHESIVNRLKNTAAPPVAALWVVSGLDGTWKEHGEQLQLAHAAGVPVAAVMLAHVHAVDDQELLELIGDYEVKDMLESAGYTGVPVVRSSAVKAMEGDARWQASIKSVMATLRQQIEPVLAAR